MSRNQQIWLYLIFVIIVPFFAVHLFPRLLSLLLISVVVPPAIVILVFDSRQTVRLRNYSNPTVEKRLTISAKVTAVILMLILVSSFTVPIWLGSYKAYILHEPLKVVRDSVSGLGSTVLAPGLYWFVIPTRQPNGGYAYLFPTVYRFGDRLYEFTILPDTNFIIDAQPL